jgi:hypothetical protein
MIDLNRLDESEKRLNDIQQSSAGRVRKYTARIMQLKKAIEVIKQKTTLLQ